MQPFNDPPAPQDADKALPKVLVAMPVQNQLDFEIEFYQGLLRRQPNYVEVLRVLGNNLTAKGEYEAGLDIDRRLARLCPGDPVAHYNLACSYSLLGIIELSLQSLRLALECGYDDFNYIEEDRDLEMVRKDPAFRELLDEFRLLN